MRKKLIFLAVLLSPNIAYAGATTDALGPGGPGYSIVLLLVLAAFGSLSGYVASALGQGQIAAMIKMLTTFGCLGVVINAVWQAISKIASVFKVGL